MIFERAWVLLFLVLPAMLVWWQWRMAVGKTNLLLKALMMAAVILAVEDGMLYLVGQYRYPLERYSWEIPEGGCAAGEDPLQAARRELEEETGLRARRWTKMGEAHLFEIKLAIPPPIG